MPVPQEDAKVLLAGLETDEAGGVGGGLAAGQEGSFSRPGTELLGEEGVQYDADGNQVEFVVLNDEVLTSVANATIVLVKGSDLERLAVLYQFPQFLEHCPDDTLETMVGEICKSAAGWTEEVQMAAAEALYFIVDMKIDEKVARRIVIAALEIVKLSSSGEVFDAWGEILCYMIPLILRNDVLSLVVPATVDRAVAQSVESRRLGARIIGSLSDSLTPKELEDLFLSHALRLCSDKDPSVRAMIAQSLSSVASKLPLRVSEKSLWPKLINLMSDQNARVRAAAMRAVAKSAEGHKKECTSSTAYRERLLPLFLRECKRAAEIASKDLREVDDDTYLMLEIFSEVYGYFLCAVSPIFADEDTWTVALNGLRRMVTCNGPTVRHWCAYNVPAVASVCGQSRPQKIKGVVHALSTDTDVETRATLAAGIHETTAILAEGPIRSEVMKAIAEVMTDQNPQVRMNSLVHFGALLEILSRSAPVSLESEKTGAKCAARELKPVFTSMEMMLHDSWRTQQQLCIQLDKVMHLIPQDLLCEIVAPLLFQLARESTNLVRKSAMSALIRIVRVIPDIRRRDHIMKHMKSEWARGKVYWTRMAYIEGSSVAMELFSRKLFTQLFASDLLNLSKDPIPNVRLKLAQIIPDLVRTCGSTKPSIAMDSLLNDSDEDVAAEAARARKRIAQLKPLTVQEEKLDAEKEAAEKAFYIAKKRKKPASSTAATNKDKPTSKAPETKPSSRTTSAEDSHQAVGSPDVGRTMNGVRTSSRTPEDTSSRGSTKTRAVASHDVGSTVPEAKAQTLDEDSDRSLEKQVEEKASKSKAPRAKENGTIHGEENDSFSAQSDDQHRKKATSIFRKGGFCGCFGS